MNANALPILLIDNDIAHFFRISRGREQWYIEETEQITLSFDDKQNPYFDVRLTKKQRPVLLLSPSQYQDEVAHSEWMNQYKNSPTGYWIAPNEQQSFAYHVATQTLDDIAKQCRIRRRIFYAIDCYDFAILNFLQEFKLNQENMLILCEWKKIIRCLCVTRGVLTKIINTSVYGVIQGNSTPEAILTQKLIHYYPHHLSAELNIFTIGDVPLSEEALPNLWKMQPLYVQSFFEDDVCLRLAEGKEKTHEPILLPLIGAGMYYAKYAL